MRLSWVNSYYLLTNVFGRDIIVGLMKGMDRNDTSIQTKIYW